MCSTFPTLRTSIDRRPGRLPSGVPSAGMELSDREVVADAPSLSKSSARLASRQYEAVDEHAFGQVERGGVGQQLVVVGVEAGGRVIGELVLDVGDEPGGAGRSEHQVGPDGHRAIIVQPVAELALHLQVPSQGSPQPLGDEPLEQHVHVQHERRGLRLADPVLKRQVWPVRVRPAEAPAWCAR